MAAIPSQWPEGRQDGPEQQDQRTRVLRHRVRHGHQVYAGGDAQEHALRYVSDCLGCRVSEAG